MSRYKENLLFEVINMSEGNNWESAVLEWEIVGCIEDESASSQCLCGKENIRYLFYIKNSNNGNVLFPIGSSCVNKFGRSDLREQVSIQESLYKLLHAVESKEFISLDSSFFSRKLLKFLYDEGVFKPNSFNEYDGKNDYQFMLDMFNKRDKTTITTNQKKKIDAIILNSIKPYLKKELKFKKMSTMNNKL